MDTNGNGFKKFDAGKPRWSLMPWPALREVLKVLEVGAKTYGDWNWKDNHKEVKWSRYMDAFDRHYIDGFKEGQDYDKVTGIYELAHAICNLIFLLIYQIFGLGIDDRPRWRRAPEEVKTVEFKTLTGYPPIKKD